LTRPNYSPETLRWLRARCEENLIISNFVELVETRDTRARPKVDKFVLRRLKNYGVVTTISFGVQPYEYHLSPKCLRVIQDLEERQNMTPIVPARATENAQSGRIDPHGESRVIEGMEVRKS